jgi:hypothetical protein
MKENFVVIFPDPQLQAWDHLPRFAFLDTDLAKLTYRTKIKERIRAPVKDGFVGATMRSSQQAPTRPKYIFD